MYIRLKNLIAMYAVFTASYLLGAVWLINDSSIVDLAREDGIIENIGAVSFLIAAIFFLGLYCKSSAFKNNFFTIKTNRNVYFLLLALLLFICFGEEISWGQRIFNWETPEAISSISMQNETNLHNLNN